MMTGVRRIGLALAALAATVAPEVSGAPVLLHRFGLFTDDSDVGTVKQAGSTRFDAPSGTYRVVGNGDDLWAARDDFHFVSRRATGDLAITASITPVISSGEPHSKAGLMVRQDLTPDSPYADIVVHQNGLVALQYRQTPGGVTHEIDMPHAGPGRFRLTRKGDYVAVAIAGEDGTLRAASGWVLVKLRTPYRVGLLVCSHSDTRMRTDDFTAVEITPRG